MSDSRIRSIWRYVTLEIAIVTVGILVAFALNSWWESRSDRARERAMLATLRGDFAQNAQQLEARVELEDSIVARTRQLLALARQPRIDETTARNLMSRVFNSGRFEPVMGAYQTVVSSGGLAQIRDDTLRSRLADFAASVNTRYADAYADNLYFAIFHDFSGRLGFPWFPTPTGLPGTDSIAPPLWNYTALLHDPGFQESLALRAFAERDVGNTYRALLASARAILDRLDSAGN